MKKVYYLVITLALLLVGVITYDLSLVKSLKDNNAQLISNQKILLDSVSHYVVSDSLNAAKVGALKLSLGEYKKYRAEDTKLISTLKSKLSDISKVISTKVRTEYKIKTEIRDSIIRDTLQLACFDYRSKWADVSGCIDRDTVELQVINRESLKVVETIQYKRFLGFLWKTNKIKSQTVDVVSENPNTQIVDIEHVQIVK